MADSKSRKALVTTMQRLLRKQGFAATGLNQVLAESGAPKGSLYYYFPEGKAQLANEALASAGDLVRRTLQSLRDSEKTPAGMLRAYGGLLAGWMSKSGYSDGCPITTTLLETVPAHAAISQTGRAAFASWEAVFADALVEAGVQTARASDLALLAIMTIEGALILARAKCDATPIRVATEEVASLFERETA